MANVVTVPAVQLRTVALVKAASTQATPAGVAGPATWQFGPPRTNRRTAVAGSTTCSSIGLQQKGPPPWVQELTLATTRLFVPCHPVGQRVDSPVSLNIWCWFAPPRSSTYMRVEA